jgi:hypothetical protein
LKVGGQGEISVTQSPRGKKHENSCGSKNRVYSGVTNTLGPCPVSAAIICIKLTSKREGKGDLVQEKAETMEFDKAAFVDILRKLIGENR